MRTSGSGPASYSYSCCFDLATGSLWNSRPRTRIPLHRMCWLLGCRVAPSGDQFCYLLFTSLHSTKRTFPPKRHVESTEAEILVTSLLTLLIKQMDPSGVTSCWSKNTNSLCHLVMIQLVIISSSFLKALKCEKYYPSVIYLVSKNLYITCRVSATRHKCKFYFHVLSVLQFH